MSQKKSLALILTVCTFTGIAAAQVKVWEEDLILPSYRLASPDPNPIFYRNESYQGAQKRIYPYALMDGITNIKGTETFKAVYLENEYIKLCVLPQIGGRLFYATDKTNGYEIFYRQQVIKPALIGMLGAWISGGIEWCVFHHHRNTTHMPIDYAMLENPDGSKTIWIGEIERRHRMRWLISITLYPGRSLIEAKVKLINRTALPHSILYWANVAVHVNNDYQVIFPPSVQAATFHAKNDFVNWPIGKGYYQGSDYTGQDLSWWKNHPRQVSCFAWDLQEDFMGGYDHNQQAGVVHVGNHFIINGAKLWEWAPGNIWDTKVLTDKDGPYAELMVGAYSDNQPDYSWIKPYEVKEFTHFWYPIRSLGGFKKANIHGAVNLELDKSDLKVGFHTTAPLQQGQVLVNAREKTLLQQQVSIDPGRPFLVSIPVEQNISATDLKAVLLDAKGHPLVEYEPQNIKPLEKLPEPVKTPVQPQDIPTIEELYLAGKRIEQIYKPSLNPMIYFQEALKRDPEDARTNTAVGKILYQNGEYMQSEKHLRRAVKRMSIDYTRPIDTEALYFLGLVLKAQAQLDDAYEAFYRATWDQAYNSAAYLQLAFISCQKYDYSTALEQVDFSLSTNSRNTRAKNLRAAILRLLGHNTAAEKQSQMQLESDPLDFYALNELYLNKIQAGQQDQAQKVLQQLKTKMRGDVHSYLELATDYIASGMAQEASDILLRIKEYTYPLVSYYLGYIYALQNETVKSAVFFETAASLPYAYCFPYRPETAAVLNSALRINPEDARAYYYLGNLYYDLQPEKAIAFWEKARDINPSLPVTHRNLGWGYQQQQGDLKKAISSYKRAIQADPNDPRFYLELDDLYKLDNTEPRIRLELLQADPGIVAKRKDLLIRKINLQVLTGEYEQAINALSANKFFISEGGGRELGNAYVDSHLLRGLQMLRQGQADKALLDFKAASFYPENLSQESLQNEARQAQILYYTAFAHNKLGQVEQAAELFKTITELTLNLNWRLAKYFQALAWKKLGYTEKTMTKSQELIAWAEPRLQADSDIDFFAKFGAQTTSRMQQAEAHFVIGLGLLLQEKTKKAEDQFIQALELNKTHTWAGYFRFNVVPF